MKIKYVLVSSCAIILTATATSTAAPTPTPVPAPQAINLSTRMLVETGDNVGVGGFIITGSAPKHVLLRAIGPSLAQFGIPNVLTDPVLELHGPDAFVTLTNDNWRDDPAQEAAILADGIPPNNDLESAIDATLNPGAYTAIVRGKNNTSGVGLVEVYDLSQAVLAKLANISTRAFVSTGSDIVIAGFILGGQNGNDRIVVRGIGPSLRGAGVLNPLANPTLELRDGNGALLIANNDWQDDPVQALEIAMAGLAPANNFESAIAATLPPGLYTALLAGAGIDLVGANNTLAVLQPSVGEHSAWSGAGPSGATLSPIDSQNLTENLRPNGVAHPITASAPTRSSFMANWNSANGATGYRLDVSTNSSFSSYVNGYQDLDVGNVIGRVVTGLRPDTTYYYRVRAHSTAGISGDSNVITGTTVSTAGLTINATFDSSILNDPNSAAIQAMITQAIAIYESLFSDPITISVLFRYSNVAPDGTPFPSGSLARSDYVVYTVPWNTYRTALRADAYTRNDTTANASLPASSLSPNIIPSSAGGRAIGLNTPGAMCADGTFNCGNGMYDGIVTLNSSAPFQFTRPPSSSNFDALGTTEHEIDEVLGLGSYLNSSGSDLRPQDLFSWSASGIRNTTSSGSRFFSIDSGSTNIVSFNQDSNRDFGDWLSAPCPQANPYVQNASGCMGQFSDVTAASPEGIDLDVIGYDLGSGATTIGIGLVEVYDLGPP